MVARYSTTKNEVHQQNIQIISGLRTLYAEKRRMSAQEEFIL